MFKHKYNRAFTIVELLVVVVIIGILATITIVSYSGVQSRAVAASLKADLSSVSRMLSVYQAFNDSYPSTLAEANNGNPLPSGSGTTYPDYYPTATGYCVTAVKNSIKYRITNDIPARPGACSGPQKDNFSLLKWNTWTLGVGGATNYGVNGDGNSRINDVDPWGKSSVIWDISNQDAASDADGGWNTSNFAIDNSKAYRFSVFAKRKFIGDGSFYLGTHGYPDAVLSRSTGVADSNPYFCSRAWWGNADQWYLIIGHIWPAGSGTGSARVESGIYTMSGTKLLSCSDYVWQPTTTSANERVYLYYSTNTSTNQQLFQPRVEVADGTEPSIQELLANSF